MNKEYKIKLDLNKKLYNKKMAFNQFDKNVNDFYIEVTKNNEVVKDLDKSIITLVAIKPNNAVDAQFIEVKEGQIYADLKPSMCDLVGNYQAKAMIVLEGEIVTTDTINYSVSEDKIISRLNDDVVSDERFPLFTDALARLSTIEISEEQRVINEAERILSEENRKIEESKRVEAELVRQHEEADRTKYDATRESNENIRKINEEARISSENVRLENEANRIEQETNRVKAEQLRKDNYNFMTEDEERRRLEANAHKEAEVLRVQAETNRVNEEAKRRTTEQARVLAENTRVSNENTRKANEETRQNNETHRVEAETQRQSRYNSFIADAEANANNFENYTNNAKVKEEERKSNELDRKSQEARRVSNEVERISNENTRKANEKAREKNETSRQNIFENKADEVDKKIIELNTIKDNFVSSINTKVDTKISELDNTKSDMTNTVTNKIDEVENRFNALTSKQQQDAEVIDARDGETSLKARLDRDIEKAKQVYVNIEGSHISTDSSVGYAKNIEILGNTVQDSENLADIRSVGDKVEGQELYEIPVLSVGKNLFNGIIEMGDISATGEEVASKTATRTSFIRIKKGINYVVSGNRINSSSWTKIMHYDINKKFIATKYSVDSTVDGFIRVVKHNPNQEQWNFQIEEGTQATPYEPYIEDKLTILSPVQLEKVGDVRDRIICKDGVWGVEKNIYTATVDSFYQHSNKQLWYIHKDKAPSWKSKNVWNEISNRVMCNYYKEVATYNEVSVTEGIFIDHKGATPNIIIGTNDANVNSLPSDLIVKYQLETPQFIPLPHDQQVKLRTFANKTNISFLTEIEGTIKAQVPKSLGATINTHNEQINNLNKELDRVKKLEESTVSTVTTESDFTTVEATSGGYFEDVKLEGKTLINLFNFKAVGIVNEVNIYGYAQNYELTKGKEVTLVNNTDKVVIYDISKDSIWVRSYILNANTCIKATLEESEYIRCCYGAGARGWDANSESDKEKIKKTCIVLEGDHTQNLHSYFEGLKSVGDGVDEIVVSSVNPNGNLFDGELEVGSLNASGDTDWTSYVKTGLIRVNPSSEVICRIGKYKGENATSTDIRLAEYDMNKNFIKFSGGTYKATVSNKTHYVKFAKKLEASDDSRVDINAVSDVVVVIGNELHDTPHQSDKKRLLYYNTETQTWEKPILRQWDSIEKHANGKYYYHQRSGEVVLNGSEEWASWLLLENTIGFLLTNTSFKNTTDKYAITAISDKLTSRSINDFKSDVEGIGLWDDRNRLVTRVNNSKLSTQDVQGFKQWLQTNNVTVVYQLAEEKVYECTNIDLITYVNETNYVIESGVLSPKTTLKVHSNISNVVSLLQKKVSLLESNMTKYMITQNRLMLASRYNADTVSFKVDVASFSDAFEYDNDLYELILNNVLVGKDNYNREYIENLIRFYWMDFVISDEMYSTLFEIIEEQHNPKIEEETPLI